MWGTGEFDFLSKFSIKCPPSGNKYWSNTHHFAINFNKYYINKSHLVVQIALTQAQNANQNPQGVDAIATSIH
jgi:hypothetical protein